MVTRGVLQDISFAAFSSPSEFESNIRDIDENATIYLDSNFPDTDIKGEDWSEKLFNLGFTKIYMCSTNKINTDEYLWLSGAVDKNKPFSLDNDLA